VFVKTRYSLIIYHLSHDIIKISIYAHHRSRHTDVRRSDPRGEDTNVYIYIYYTSVIQIIADIQQFSFEL